MAGVEMHIVDPASAAACARYAEQLNAIDAIDAPWFGKETGIRVRWQLNRTPNPPVLAIFTERGREVAIAEMAPGYWDNRTMMQAELRVLHDVRRQGHGRAALEMMQAFARSRGCTTLSLNGRDCKEVRGFAAATGQSIDQIEVLRALDLRTLNRGRVEALYQQSRLAAEDYELLRFLGPTPPELLPALVEVVSSINDAPMDDLGWEDDVYSVERIAATERHYSAPESRFRQIIARHRETGELVGHTVVVCDPQAPTVGDQHETSVKRTHRGHRLGLLMKAAMTLWLLDDEPRMERIVTWNASTNPHMIAVNEQLGFVALSQWLTLQRDQ